MLITLKHPFFKLSCDLVELCKPLDLFNIHHFTYLKQCNDGHRIGLSNKPLWIQDYYNLNLFHDSFFEGKPSTYHEKFDAWYGDYDLDVYRHGKLHYNTMHSITITKPVDDGCEFYLFAAAPECEADIRFLAEHRDILYHFIYYFKDHFSKSLIIAERNKLFIPPFPNKIATPSHMDNNLQHAMLDKKNLFFRQTRIFHYTFERGLLSGIKLSNREIDCIAHLLNNRTAPEIGASMNISTRTAESYIDNIKSKLNCDNRASLISTLKKHQPIGVLRPNQP